MSGIVKGIKKVFKKIVKVVKKIAKPLLIAAAVVFTGGLALSAFPAMAGFAASLPGFAGGGFLGLGIGATATAGTGMFSALAGAIGLGGGIAAGAIGAGTSLAALPASLQAAGAAALTGGTAASTAAIAAGAPMAGQITQAALVSGGPALAGTGITAATAAAKMTFTEKLLLGSMGMNAVGALLAPSAKSIARDQAIEAAKFRGSFYGLTASGEGFTAAQGPGSVPSPAGAVTPVQPPGPAPTPPPQNLFSNVSAPPTQQQGGGMIGPEGLPTIQAPAVEPIKPFPNPIETTKNLFAQMPGVRYV